MLRHPGAGRYLMINKKWIVYAASMFFTFFIASSWGNCAEENSARIIRELSDGSRVMLEQKLPRFSFSSPNAESAARVFAADLESLSDKLPFNTLVSLTAWYPLNGSLSGTDWKHKADIMNACLKELHDRDKVALIYFQVKDIIEFTKTVLGDWDEDEMRLSADGKRRFKDICFNNPKTRDRGKQLLTKFFSTVNMDGIYFEEPGWFGSGFCHCRHCQAAFKEYLLKKYGTAVEIERKLGKPLAEIRSVGNDDRLAQKELWYEWYRFCQHSLADFLQDLSLHARKVARERWGKEIITTATTGYDGAIHPYAGVRHTEFLSGDAMTGMCNAYYWQDFDRRGAALGDISFKRYHLRVKFCKGQSHDKPVWFYVIGKNEPGWAYEIGIYDAILAGCNGFFTYAQSAEVADGYKRAADFIERNMDAIGGQRPYAEVAILNSYEQTSFGSFGLQSPGAYDYVCRHIFPTFYAFSDAHIPVNYITGFDSRELAKYKVLVVDEIRNMSAEDIRTLKNWVLNGGNLVAMGFLGGRDIYERDYPQYPLAELLGIGGAPAPIKASCLKREDGAAIAYGRYLPVGYFGSKMLLCQDAYEFAPRAGVSVLVRWDDGRPAVIAHNYGKGRVIYSGAFFHFLEGKEATAMIKGIFRGLLGGLPLESNLPSRVDFNTCLNGGKFLVYLLNLEEVRLKDIVSGSLMEENIAAVKKPVPLKLPNLKVKLPPGLLPQACYLSTPEGAGRERISFKREGDYLVMSLPELRDLIMLTIEGGGK
jgi:hypothetical protein